MTKKFVLIALVSLFFATKASAQPRSESEGFNSVYVQWNPSTFKPSEGESTSFTGITLGYNHGFNLVANVPLFLEVGGAIQYSFRSKEETLVEEALRYLGTKVSDNWMYTEKVSFLSLKIPINLSYKHYFPNSNIAIAPYAGIILRGNIYGVYKIDANSDLSNRLAVAIASGTAAYKWNLIPMSTDKDLFNKDDMGEDGVWKRFQIGWQAGINLYFSKFFAGASYGTDFTEISKDCNIRTVSVTCGYVF